MAAPASDCDVPVAESGLITLGRPKAELVPTNDERERLRTPAARKTSAEGLAQAFSCEAVLTLLPPADSILAGQQARVDVVAMNPAFAKRLSR